MLKADLHIHTYRSPDSTMSPQAIIDRCLELKINCLAITDHNTIAGAVEVKEKAPFLVIVGEEIKTSKGEIIGLFLTEVIPPGLHPREVAARIKAQGGLVCIPHPFDRFRRSRLDRRWLIDLIPDIDIIEVFNSRNSLIRDSLKAAYFARRQGLLMSAGSDAHILREIGGACMVMPDFDGREGFSEALAQGRILAQRASPSVHLYSAMAKLRKRLRRK